LFLLSLTVPTYERLYSLLWFANSILVLFQALFLSEGVLEGLVMGSELESRSDPLLCPAWCSDWFFDSVWMLIAGLLGVGASTAAVVLYSSTLSYSAWPLLPPSRSGPPAYSLW
jgi:hypothetical protein